VEPVQSVGNRRADCGGNSIVTAAVGHCDAQVDSAKNRIDEVGEPVCETENHVGEFVAHRSPELGPRRCGDSLFIQRREIDCCPDRFQEIDDRGHVRVVGPTTDPDDQQQIVAVSQRLELLQFAWAQQMGVVDQERRVDGRVEHVDRLRRRNLL
jgi:hypothetical protein